MKTLWRNTLAGALAAGLTACSTTEVNRLDPAQTSGRRQPLAHQQVLTDSSLAKTVSVLGVNTAETADGLLRVQVELVNRQSTLQTFFYLVEWFDAQGLLVPTTGGGWTRRQILGQETQTLTAIAPSPQCKDFRMQFVEFPK